MHKIVKPNLQNLSFPSSNFDEEYKGKEGRTRQCMNYGEAASAIIIAVDMGHLFNNHLHDVSARVQEIALHSVHRGAAVALAAAQVQTGHDLCTMEPGFPMADDPDMHEDLIEEFDNTTAAIMDITSAQDVINKVLSSFTRNRL